MLCCGIPFFLRCLPASVNRHVPEPDKICSETEGMDVREAISDRKNINTNNIYTCQCHRQQCSQCVQNTNQACQPGNRDVLCCSVIHRHQGQWGCVESSSKSFENTVAPSGVWGKPTLFKSSYITYTTLSDKEQTLHVCLPYNSPHLYTIRL